jgi:molecular chaperone GrpE (heat shock protein)
MGETMDDLLRRSDLLRMPEVADKHALRQLVTSLISTLEHLDRWLGATEDAAEDLPTAERRLSLVRRQLRSALLDVGVRPSAAVGMKLDLRRHEIVSQHETADSSPDTIIRVVSNGYVFQDEILRTAQVTVAVAAGACAEE